MRVAVSDPLASRPRASTRLDAAVVWLPACGCLSRARSGRARLGLRAVEVSPLLASTLLVVLLLALTGALHADGLMDTCDAVFGHATPERRLEIMRDPHTGAFGVVGLVCVVVLKMAALDALPVANRVQMLVLAPTLGRWAIVLLARCFRTVVRAAWAPPQSVCNDPVIL